MSDKNLEPNTNIKAALKSLSLQDFKNFGLHQIAYIRPIANGSHTAYSIHAADGEKLSVIDTLSQAIITARHNDLEPVTVH